MYEFLRPPADQPPVDMQQLLDTLREHLRTHETLRVSPLSIPRDRGTGLPAERQSESTDLVQEMIVTMIDDEMVCSLRHHTQLDCTLLSRYEERNPRFSFWTARAVVPVLRAISAARS